MAIQSLERFRAPREGLLGLRVHQPLQLVHDIAVPDGSGPPEVGAWGPFAGEVDRIPADLCAGNGVVQIFPLSQTLTNADGISCCEVIGIRYRLAGGSECSGLAASAVLALGRVDKVC